MNWFKYARKTWEQSPRNPLNPIDPTFPTFPFVSFMENAMIDDEEYILRSILEPEYYEELRFNAAAESNPVFGQLSPQQIDPALHISSRTETPPEIFSTVSTTEITDDFISAFKGGIHQKSMPQFSQGYSAPAFERQNIKKVTVVEDLHKKSTGPKNYNLQGIEDENKRTCDSKSDFSSPLSDELQSETASKSDSVDAFRNRIVEALTKFEPDTLKYVDALLMKFKGKENCLIQSLYDKYSDPSHSRDHEIGSNPFRQKLVVVLKNHEPDQHKSTNELKEEFKGNEEAFIEKIETKYAVDFKPTNERRSDEVMTNQSRVQTADALTKNDPSRLADANYLLENSNGTKDEHLKRIEGKNGKNEKVAQESFHDGMNGTNHYREMLVAFYEEHNPAKLDTVNETLISYQGREELLFKKLHEKYVTGKDGILPASGEGPTCFIDFQLIGSVEPQRVTIKLFADKVPLACENFRVLCTGEMGMGRSGKPLCFMGSSIHRIVSNFCVQGGDFTKSDGTGGESIYSPNSKHGDMWGKFKDEKFMMHSRKGLLSMANNGANRNSSQFFFTLRAIPHLDGKHVVFGECVSGFEVIERIEKIPTNSKQKPNEEVLIVDCGLVKGDGLLVRASDQLKTTRKFSAFNTDQSSRSIIQNNTIITSVFTDTSTCLDEIPISLFDTIKAVDSTPFGINDDESRKHALSKDDVLNGPGDFKSRTQETSEIEWNTSAGDEQCTDINITLMANEQHILDPSGVSIRTVEPILMVATKDETSLGPRHNGSHPDFISVSNSIAQSDNFAYISPPLPSSDLYHVRNLDELQTSVDASCHILTGLTKDDQTVSDASTTLAKNVATSSENKVPNSTAAKIAEIVFNTFDNQRNGKLPITILAELLNALDEELDNIALTAAIQDVRSDDGDFDRESFMIWYHGYVLENGVDSMDDNEQGREKSKISDIFNTFSTDGGLSISAADFGTLVSELGMSCNGAELFATIEQIKDSNDNISRDSFHKWYLSWHFGIEVINKVTDDGDIQRVSHRQIDVAPVMNFGGFESESQEASFGTVVDAHPNPFIPRFGAARTTSATNNGGSAKDSNADSM